MKTKTGAYSLLCLLSVITGTLILATTQAVLAGPPPPEERVGKPPVPLLEPGPSHQATQSLSATVDATIQCPPHMLSYWHLDEETGGTYEDGYGTYDGLCAGSCPTAAAGLIGGAQQFNRFEGTGINVPGELVSWEDNESFSVEFWMTDPGDVSGHAAIVGRQGATDSEPYILVGVGDGGLASFSLYASSADGASLQGTTDLRLGGWHHVVAVYDASGPGTLRLYVDGQVEAFTTHDYASDFVTTTPLNVGWLNSASGHHYDGKLDELAIYQRALTETEIKTHYYLARSYCQTCEAAVRIMPLGDSITMGNASGAEPDEEGYWISYRKDLWQGLTMGGYNVDFVGGQFSGYDVTPPFDADHEGHSGRTDHWLRDQVVGFLTENPADVVLLHIGTNAVDPDPQQVEEILDNIDSVSKDITVVLARIINRMWYSSVTTAFNDNIQAMAESRMDPASPHYTGDKIIIVDMENGADLIYAQAPSYGDMWNGVHPYKTGYAKMANVWLNGDSHGSDGLRDFLPVCAPYESPIAPDFVSPAHTTFVAGAADAFTVEATGVPTPRIILSGALPEGVIFTHNDDGTTTLSGTADPGSRGVYPLTLTASNGVEPDATQAFILTVSTRVYLPLMLRKH